MRIRALIATAALLLLGPLSAQAGDWALNYTCTDVNCTDSGTIFITTSDTLTPSLVSGGPAGYLIESISGTADGAAITGLAPPTRFPPCAGITCNGYIFDNGVTPGPGLDIYGIGLFTADGLFHNLFYNGAGTSGTGAGIDGICPQTASDCAPGGFFTTNDINFTIQAPEPATLGLMFLGLTGAALIRRRRTS
jgi:PEP-CTERM motif